MSTKIKVKCQNTHYQDHAQEQSPEHVLDFGLNSQEQEQEKDLDTQQNKNKKIKLTYKMSDFDVQFINNLKECGLNEDIANEFNLALNNYFLENCKYTMHALCLYKSLVFNMMKNNKMIIDSLNTTRNYYTVADMTFSELSPETFKDVFEHIERIKEIKNTKTVSTIIQCSRCKQKSTTYYFKQVRSMDEGMTCFITCNVCGKEWRQ